MLVSSLAVCRESMRALEAKVEKLQAAEAAYLSGMLSLSLSARLSLSLSELQAAEAGYLSAGASSVERARVRESERERERARESA